MSTMNAVVLVVLVVLAAAGSRQVLGQSKAHDLSGHIDVSLPAASIGHYLKSLPRRELGESQLQDLISLVTSKGQPRGEDEERTLGLLCQRLDNKLHVLKHHLSNLSTEFSSSSSFVNEHDPPPPCCSSHLHSDLSKGCSVIHYGDKGTSAAKLAAKVFEERDAPKGCIRRFFMSTDKSAHVEFPAARACSQQAFNWHLEAFVSTLHPAGKNAIILLDRGHSLSTLQLDVGRAIAGFILESLNEKDHVSLITLDERVSVVDNQNCGHFARATSTTKKAFQSHLNAINRISSYSYFDQVQGLHEAEKMVLSKEKTHLFFISSANAIKSPSQWVQTYEKMVAKHPNLVLHVYFMDKVLDDDKDGHSSLKYFNDTISKWKKDGIKAELALIDSTLLLSYNMGNFFFGSEKLLNIQDQPIVLSSPRINDKDTNTDVIFTMTTPIVVNEEHIEAVVGFDIAYKYLLEDVAFDSSDKSSYYCVIDKSSQSVVYHPKLYQSYEDIDLKIFPQGVRLSTLEEVALEEQIMASNHGHMTTTQKLLYKTKHYYWKHVQDTFVVILIREEEKADSLPILPTNLSPVLAVYHRLDLLPASFQAKLCRHLHLPATLESGSVFLSPAAFEEPFDSIHANMTTEKIDKTMSYLINSSNELSDNFLKSGVREDVQLLAQALNTWKNMSFSSGMNNYIVRRFSATSKGAIFSYPGSPMLESTDPTGQDWYLAAHQFPHRVIVNRPKLDVGGAGYILTVSKLISGNDLNERKGHSLVLGMDLTMGYVYNMLLDTLPICNNDKNVRCFLFDHEGYLIVHPSQFEANEEAKVEGLHLTQVEHLAVKLMHEDKTLVTRQKCKRYLDMTIQNFYEFNTSLSLNHATLWTNLNLNEDSCFRYQVSSLPGTNLFLGLVLSNDTCSKKEDATFCPCSVRGRQCILCQEESLSCECPCECPLKQQECPNLEDIPLCPQQPQNLRAGQPSTDHPSQMLSELALPPCFDPDCSRHNDKDKCFGVIGCSWCAYERKAGSSSQLTVIDEPFCNEQSKCFAGVLGASSPYDKLERGSRRVMEGEDNFFRPTPSIGPIAGSIVSAVLFLGLSAYCIRNYNKCICTGDNSNSRLRLRHGSSLQVANFEEVVEDNLDHEELRELGAPPHKNALMLRDNQEAIISPYRMNPGYRRPPPGTDSDHGYSTMTPIGDLDSEIVPYVESASARNRLQRMHQRNNNAPSSIQSVTSGVSSSRTSSPIPTAASVAAAAASIQRNNETMSESPVVRGTTTLPNEGVALLSTSDSMMTHPLDPETMLPIANKNQFLVSVTVHNVDIDLN